ncbi:type II secretion system protein, partial [Candidatus Curtissbacteria bacterium]|nr:type II secretion system protein [Candidatus Curtissbacteria bacterium]
MRKRYRATIDNLQLTIDKFDFSSQMSNVAPSPKLWSVGDKCYKFQRAQSLVEVIVSLGVVVILAVSLVTTGLITQRASRAARNNTQATKLAEQNIEQIRIYRDRFGFSSIATKADGCWVLDAPTNDPKDWVVTNSYCAAGGKVITLGTTAFTRKMTLTTVSANRKQITVTVSWSDSGGTQT